MNNIVQFSPSDYVDMLTNGFYQQDNGLFANLTKYLSANNRYGGSSRAETLLQCLLRVTRGQPEHVRLTNPDFQRVFTGQGLYEDIYAAMSMVESFKDDLSSDATLRSYTSRQDFLQKMVDDTYFGLDCIGFVGTYLVAASAQPAYVGRRPLDYLSAFRPLKSIGEIDDLCILTVTSGEHIQIIDNVTERHDSYIICDICQSSSGGSQTNIGVCISAGGGNYLDVDRFRAALASRSLESDWQSDNASRVAAGRRARDYESYLRSIFTEGGHAAGYMGGAIFQLSRTGSPPNPVGGSIYVGRLPDGMHIGTPPA